MKFALGLVLLGVLTGCTQNNTNNTEVSGNDSSNTVTSATESTNSTANTEDSGTKSISEDLTVTLDEAIQVFQETHPDSDITSIELDTSFGNYFYKITGVDDTYEYELRIDGKTKEVSNQSQEKLDSDEQNGVARQEKLDLTDLISIEKASAIAVNEIGSGEATDWDLDQEMSVTYWEVKVKDGLKDYQVKINAQTGAVIESEKD